jgi:hypothetical protein
MGQTRWGHVAGTVGIVFVLFGFVALFSVGLPFLLIGLSLLISLGIRNKPKVQAAIVAGTVGFTVAAALVSPLGCTASVTFGEEAGTTECDNILGIDYSGDASYDAPMWPALLAGAGVGAVSAAIAARVVGRRG